MENDFDTAPVCFDVVGSDSWNDCIEVVCGSGDFDHDSRFRVRIPSRYYFLSSWNVLYPMIVSRIFPFRKIDPTTIHAWNLVYHSYWVASTMSSVSNSNETDDCCSQRPHPNHNTTKKKPDDSSSREDDPRRQSWLPPKPLPPQHWHTELHALSFDSRKRFAWHRAVGPMARRVVTSW